MKSISIKTVDGTRYDLPPKNEIEVVERYGMHFIQLKSDVFTRFINCQYIVSITENESV